MKKKLNLSKSETRGAIVALWKRGLSIRKIAKELSVPKSTIAFNIKKFAILGSCADKKRSGRPKVTTKAEDQSIV